MASTSSVRPDASTAEMICRVSRFKSCSRAAPLKARIRFGSLRRKQRASLLAWLSLTYGLRLREFHGFSNRVVVRSKLSHISRRRLLSLIYVGIRLFQGYR